MVKEIKKEVKANIKGFIDRSKKLVIRLVSAGISFGIILIGIGTLVYIVKMFHQVNVSNDSGISAGQAKVTYSPPVRIQYVTSIEKRPLTNVNSSSNRSELENAVNTVNQVRRLQQGVTSLMSR